MIILFKVLEIFAIALFQLLLSTSFKMTSKINNFINPVPQVSEPLTVDDLCKKLRRITYSRKINKDFNRDAMIPPKRMRVYNRNTPTDALLYFDKYFDLEIPGRCFSDISDSEAANFLFDLSHFPLKLVQERINRDLIMEDLIQVVDVESC